ncbi:MAG: single-stranded-DNA-specific exonuclease RecJ, partial [Verrucomicrobiota bacterium]|nr:single-stranded-DNA-specific exonuclease RecJ [Verrucomicrobiota bacterium]
RDPFELPEMEIAVRRILQAVDKGEPTCIFGDYDVDGITSVAILRHLLSAYGLEPQTFIPIRSGAGYGLSDAAIERCLKAKVKPSLLITVDCGTASGAQIERLADQGIDVIVVDHHEAGLEGRPPAVAVVNPKFGDDYGYLCSAGVVFKLAHALLKTRRLEEVDLKELLDLVAVATIADIVPLVGENRLLVRHGLRRLPQTSNHGLRALMELSGMNGDVTSADVGFRIGPRINAAGRMDVPDDALAALMTNSSKDAAKQAKKLDDYNRQRQKCEQEMHEEALQELKKGFDETKDPVIVVGSDRWHPGVVGIVASRLMRYYHKPAFVISFDQDGMGKGSGRSIEGVSLVNAIEACRPLLEAGGGHHMAAGISLHKDRLKEFREAFSDYVVTNTTAEDRKPRIRIDAEVPFEDLSLDFLESYELLQPFGSGNQQPVFMSRGVRHTESPRRVGKNHMRLSLRQGIQERDAIYFGGGDRELPDPPWDVAFTIDRNLFRGRLSLQISVRDIRVAQ